LSEDDLIAIELGAASLEDLTEVQRVYVDKLKIRLVEVRRASCLRCVCVCVRVCVYVCVLSSGRLKR